MQSVSIRLCSQCKKLSSAISMRGNSRPARANPVLAFVPRVRKNPRAMAHVKLHIPGPVEVSEKTFRAFCSPMIGHRGQGFRDLYAKIQPQLQQLLSTRQLVFLSTSSAWGVMEG